MAGKEGENWKFPVEPKAEKPSSESKTKKPGKKKELFNEPITEEEADEALSGLQEEK